MSAIFSGQEALLARPPLSRAVFVDKDGTLVENLPYNVDPARVRFTPNAMEGLRLLCDNGYRLIVVTNQPGLAYGMFTRAALTQLQLALAEMMQREGVHLTDFYACPHAPGPAGPVPGCLCRKPAPGLLRQAARSHAIDLQRSWMIGDILDDIEAGRRAGCRTVMLEMGNETVWRLSPLRTPHLKAADLLDAARAIVAADAADEAAKAAAQPETLPPPIAPDSGAVRRGVAQAAFALQSAMARTRGAGPAATGPAR
ncbi:MAG TPA: HAD family hydrolase [Albitalea sp.]|nr:HAD family hydrolase [Albitalea sp.]